MRHSLTLRLTEEQKRRIERTAIEDYRKKVDQANYLLELGLQAREQQGPVLRVSANAEKSEQDN